MARKYEFSTTGTVKGGVLSLRNRQAMQAAVSVWPNGEVILRLEKAHANRSAQANRYYWGVVVAAIAEHTGYTPEETHEVLKQMFLPKECAMCDGNGDVVGAFVIGGSTVSLDKVEFGEYVTRCRTFAFEKLGLDIPLPDSAWAA